MGKGYQVSLSSLVLGFMLIDSSLLQFNTSFKNSAHLAHTMS
jgi:hypothetical protein